MYHGMHAQRSRQDGGWSAMFISQSIELCDVSRFVLHLAATILWVKSLFERIHFITLTAARAVKTGYKIKGIQYGMQQQTGQPLLINNLISVLAWVFKPLAEHLSVDSGTMLCPSEWIFHSLQTLLPATSFRVSGSCSITMSEWFIPRQPERVVRAPSPWASGSCFVTVSEWFMLRHPERVVHASSPWVSGSCSVTLSEWFLLHHHEW